jgi:hypothetical protein
MRVRVQHSIGDLAGDLRTVATSTPRRMSGVVRDAAKRGNRNAKAFASEEHTMFSDVDADYAPSFTAGRISPLMWEYGSDHPKATGYEFGSVNQASPHRNLDRSQDIEAVEFPLDVNDEMRLIWQQAGF